LKLIKEHNEWKLVEAKKEVKFTIVHSGEGYKLRVFTDGSISRGYINKSGILLDYNCLSYYYADGALVKGLKNIHNFIMDISQGAWMDSRGNPKKFASEFSKASGHRFRVAE